LLERRLIVHLKLLYEQEILYDHKQVLHQNKLDYQVMIENPHLNGSQEF
jgi:hypothetical protein